MGGALALVRSRGGAVAPHTVGGVITGLHALLYSTDPDATRAFLRDVLGWPFVDAHEGWLIFRSPPTEVAVHPVDGGTAHHELSFMCDDLEATVADLRAKGANTGAEVRDAGWGLVVDLEVPGVGAVILYEPRHPRAIDLPDLLT